MEMPSRNGRGMPKSQFVLEVCREGMNNACQRQMCRYAHPPTYIQIFDGKVECCGDFIKGKCFRENPRCRYFHPPAHLVANLLSSVGSNLFKDNKKGMISTLTHAIANCSAVLNAALAASGSGSGSSGGKSDKMEACRDFLNGRCQRDECRFAHPPDHVTVDAFHQVMSCIDFLNGRCNRDQCRYFHPPLYLMKERCPSTICKDYLRGKCDRNPCRFLHSADMREVDDKTREVMTCRDYLNGKCSRAVCCYYHPPQSSFDELAADAAAAVSREATPAAAYAPAAQTAGSARPTGTNEICRDFLLGRCHRSVCCYVHPTDRDLIVDKQTEMICKDFMRGICHRRDCRYFHPPIQPPVRAQEPIEQTDRLSMQMGYGSVGSRKRGYAGEPVATHFDGYDSQVYLTDYSHSSQPSNWESYQTPAKRPMANDYY